METDLMMTNWHIDQAGRQIVIQNTTKYLISNSFAIVKLGLQLRPNFVKNFAHRADLGHQLSK